MRMLASMMGVVLLGAVVGLSGCKTSEVGVTKSMGGAINAYVDALPPQVVAAAENVAKDMELTVDSAASSQLDGRFRAHTAQGKSIKVDVARYGDNISSVSIKVGTWGDESMSLDYLAAMKKKLAGRSRSASPPSTSEINLLD